MNEIIISYDKFTYNIKLIKNHIKNTKLCIVVKSDAYGHNLNNLIKYIENFDLIDYYGICENDEAKTIRQYSNKPIIRLRIATIPEIEEGLIYNIEELCGSVDMLDYYRNKHINIHIAIDSGMQNMGLSATEVNELSFDNLNIKGIMTHFKHLESSDNTMINYFLEIVKNINLPNILIHAFNSEKTLISENYFLNMVRVGALAYGLYFNDTIPCEPILQWKTKIIQIRKIKSRDTIGYLSTFVAQGDMVIAVIPIGYNNGYLREFSNKSYCLIKNTRCKSVGNISMNVTTLDITKIANIVSINDEVVIVGNQGNDSITLQELA